MKEHDVIWESLNGTTILKRVLLLSAYGETREKGQEGVLCWVAGVSMF